MLTLIYFAFRSNSFGFLLTYSYLCIMKQAMIFAAGLGTRLKPLTDTMPKALVPVGGRPLLDINLERLRQAGYTRFVVNVHHFADQIEEHLKEQDARCKEQGARGKEQGARSKEQDVRSEEQEMSLASEIYISDERELLLDTGGGLKKAAPLFKDDEPILIHNVDILDNVDYEWFRRQHQEDEDAVLLVSRRKTKRYLLFDNGMRLMGWMNIETGEVKSPYPWLRQAQLTIDDEWKVCAAADSQFPIFNYQLTAFAFSGIHSFSPRLFPLMERFPDKFGIMDFYLSICHRSRIFGCVKDDLQVLDVGKLDALDKAEEFVKLFTI